MSTIEPFVLHRPLAARPLKPGRTLRSLYTQQQVDNAIHRERCRADRAGQEFSVVLFRVSRNMKPSHTALRLARTALVRSRTTDEVGWFDPETICAILPGTAADGAGRFAENVAHSIPPTSQRPLVVVYTYPSGWFEDEDQAGHTRKILPQHLRRSVEASAPLTRKDLTPYVAQGLAAGLTPAASAHPLESLLARPMPWWKRLMDIAGAVFGLIVAAPVLMVIALAIKLTSPGPVLFKQRRAGLGGRPFYIYKFRSMCLDAEKKKKSLRALSEQDGPAFKLTDDPRVTRIGKLLRKSSLDELPQLWNVLKGDMSLVGPRPLPIDEQNGCEQWQRTRLDVTPGLTCIWQVKGRSTVSFAEWVRMDVRYIRRHSLLHDVKILLQTLPAVLRRRGAK
jgi:lipopolysaccharide/colanic/teichoic acid biosynthesis glycosyltransferase